MQKRGKASRVARTWCPYSLNTTNIYENRFSPREDITVDGKTQLFDECTEKGEDGSRGSPRDKHFSREYVILSVRYPTQPPPPT